MPWELEDVEKHKKGLTSKQKEQWVSTANSVLADCQKKGGTDCEGRAIRIANAAVKESGMNEWLKEQTADIQEKFNAILAEKEKLETLVEQAKNTKPKWLMNIGGDCVPLVEGNKKGNVVPVKIIQPGWGTSGFYPPETLENSESVFTKGTKMYWDHPTLTEDMERPERSLRDLAGEFVTNAEYKKEGIAGEGLYANAKIFKPFEDAVHDLAPHMGISIRAGGIAEEGEVDGQEGMIIKEITRVASVDFVTVPGAGGKVVELFESLRKTKRGDKEMSELEELKEANTDLVKEKGELESKIKEQEETLLKANEKLAQAEEAELLKEAADYVKEKLAECELPELTIARLVEKLSKNPILTEEKKLDKEKYAEVIDKAVKDESEYLAKIVGSGQIKGMSGSSKEEESLVESFEGLYRTYGLSEEEAKRMANISGGK